MQVGQCPPGRRVVADLGFQFPDAAPQFQDAGIVRRLYVELFCEQPRSTRNASLSSPRARSQSAYRGGTDDPLVLHPEPRRGRRAA